MAKKVQDEPLSKEKEPSNNSEEQMNIADAQSKTCEMDSTKTVKTTIWHPILTEQNQRYHYKKAAIENYFSSEETKENKKIEVSSSEKKNKPRKLFICSVCDKMFTLKSSLERHTLTQHASGHVCNTCGKYFRNRTKLHNHEKKGGCIETCICKICDRRFSSMGSLTHHLKRLHKNENQKPSESSTGGKYCDICNRAFGNEHGLNLHMSLAHNYEAFKYVPCGRKRTYISHSQRQNDFKMQAIKDDLFNPTFKIKEEPNFNAFDHFQVVLPKENGTTNDLQNEESLLSEELIQVVEDGAIEEGTLSQHKEIPSEKKPTEQINVKHMCGLENCHRPHFDRVEDLTVHLFTTHNVRILQESPQRAETMLPKITHGPEVHMMSI